MKNRLIITLLLALVVPLASQGQQLKIYTDSDGYKYFAVYAYGLPREVVKTNSQIKASKYGSSGIIRRHHTTSYAEGGITNAGDSINYSISFAFVIAPFNVNEQGKEIPANQSQTEISWYAASGWDPSIDSEGVKQNMNTYSIPNTTPTGCAAYTGPNDNDPQGTWRLPTQREALIMFTIMEHALTMQDGNEVTNNITNGKFWTSTELKTSAHWKVWYVDSKGGSLFHDDKISAFGYCTTGWARCVKDIDNDPIND